MARKDLKWDLSPTLPGGGIAESDDDQAGFDSAILGADVYFGNRHRAGPSMARGARDPGRIDLERPPDGMPEVRGVHGRTDEGLTAARSTGRS